jgi:hypothetical protein
VAYRTDRAQLRIDLRPPEKRPDGSTRYHGALTKSGVFEYELEDGTKRLEYRPPEEVSRADSLETMQLAPVVARAHTPKGEARTRSVGTVGQDVSWVADKAEVQATFVVRTDDVNQAIADGMQELSCGYDVDLDETPGTTPKGERYDAIQRGLMRPDGTRGPIIYEHLAIVPSGRAGSSVRLRADSTTSRPSWRTDSACMISAAAPVGDAAINDSAATGRSKEAAMADKQQTNGTRADGGNDMANDGVMPPPAGAPAPVSETDMLKAEVAKLKEALAKMTAAQDSAQVAAAAPVARANDAHDEEDEETAGGIADPKARMDAMVDARFKREEVRRTAESLGVNVRADARTTEIKRLVVEKLDGKLQQERLDSFDGKGRVVYIASRYDAAIERHGAAIAAEQSARGGRPVTGPRHDAKDPIRSAFAEQQARFDARGRVGGAK